MIQNLSWNENTKPSEILKQILNQEEKSTDKTINNIYALTFAMKKAEALEYLHDKHIVTKKE